jgi:hypothetical protein
MIGMDCSVLCWSVLENGLWIHEIYILNISESGLDAWQQKKCKTSFLMTLISHYSLLLLDLISVQNRTLQKSTARLPPIYSKYSIHAD